MEQSTQKYHHRTRGHDDLTDFIRFCLSVFGPTMAARHDLSSAIIVSEVVECPNGADPEVCSRSWERQVARVVIYVHRLGRFTGVDVNGKRSRKQVIHGQQVIQNC